VSVSLHRNLTVSGDCLTVSEMLWTESCLLKLSVTYLSLGLRTDVAYPGVPGHEMAVVTCAEIVGVI